MSGFSVFTKDPDATLDYGFDWSDWLADGEVISDSDWTVTEGITEDSATLTTTQTMIWLSGGTEGTRYTITNTITTSAGRIDDRSFFVDIRER